MLEHVQRNLLPEDHKNFYDIHSAIAVSAFKLKCEPTKEGLKQAGKKHLRIVAKSIIFGLMYGRGANAVADSVKEEGVYVTVAEVQQVMNTVKQTYKKAMIFLQDAANAVSVPGYIVGVSNRYRRRPIHQYLATEKMRDLERVFKNFPEQNFVAEVVRQCLKNLWNYRKNNDIYYEINMQVHDEIVLSVPYKYVAEVVDKVLPLCMVEQVPIIARGLDGVLDTKRGPYFLGIDTSVGFQYSISEPNWRDIVQSNP